MIPKNSKFKVGMIAPDFTLPDQNGKIHSLSDYRGNWVLLYFYPKDFTGGCAAEACGIRDQYAGFKKSKIAVLGVSVDSIKSHWKFAAKYRLPFTLLADEKKGVVEKYGVWQTKSMMGRSYMGTVRTSFLIDPRGQIAKIYTRVKPEGHASEVLSNSRKRM